MWTVHLMVTLVSSWNAFSTSVAIKLIVGTVTWNRPMIANFMILTLYTMYYITISGLQCLCMYTKQSREADDKLAICASI